MLSKEISNGFRIGVASLALVGAPLAINTSAYGENTPELSAHRIFIPQATGISLKPVLESENLPQTQKIDFTPLASGVRGNHLERHALTGGVKLITSQTEWDEFIPKLNPDLVSRKIDWEKNDVLVVADEPSNVFGRGIRLLSVEDEGSARIATVLQTEPEKGCVETRDYETAPWDVNVLPKSPNGVMVRYVIEDNGLNSIGETFGSDGQKQVDFGKLRIDCTESPDEEIHTVLGQYLTLDREPLIRLRGTATDTNDGVVGSTFKLEVNGVVSKWDFCTPTSNSVAPVIDCEATIHREDLQSGENIVSLSAENTKGQHSLSRAANTAPIWK